eukprot:CAMPEP_0184698348 /NCGR_PEP_ID=MMETSP0313-20130426/5004_1 /TAXON_ID=2792 /ORGANISM="Porphyridium aerugineum, Strain SAG 1380-2" /LENGTH=488 /DNA_ID=CAMNT_0027157277 /DNA_START=145 /DNA_END=1611 /DNA_ORIENTATION=-
MKVDHGMDQAGHAPSSLQKPNLPMTNTRVVPNIAGMIHRTARSAAILPCFAPCSAWTSNSLVVRSNNACMNAWCPKVEAGLRPRRLRVGFPVSMTSSSPGQQSNDRNANLNINANSSANVNANTNGSIPATPSDAKQPAKTQDAIYPDRRQPDAAVWLEKINEKLWRKTPKLSRSKLRNVRQRVISGILLGIFAVGYVFSGTAIFAIGIAAIAILGQVEYYKMAEAKGHMPAKKLGIATTLLHVLVSYMYPNLADAVFPIASSVICCYLLFRKRPATIADISTSFLGLFYAGLLPSYWVRLHGFSSFGPFEEATTAAIVRKVYAALSGILPATVFSMIPDLSQYIKTGALVVFWTWLAHAFADVGAYIVGKRLGVTQFTNISPKKTVEGCIGGFVFAIGFSLPAAYFLGWPFWQISGTVYGIMVAAVGLLGDLTESLFKRDAGMKDSGDMIPGHGGILDRTDSYVFTAPLVFYLVTAAMPALRAFLLR